MNRTLTLEQVQHFKTVLKARFKELRGEIRDELLRSDDARYQKLAGEVHDSGDEAIADLLVDIGNADLDRDVEEIRDIDAALLRIADGSYGVCADCGGAIPVDRLEAYPTAKRCRPCQQRYERGHRRSAATTR
jgi:RNA polymerase-binding protein DksA